jgi:hypothetical protein
VIGGLPLTICLLAILWLSMKTLGTGITAAKNRSEAEEFALWCVGATIFAHAITFLSISYFDQISMFFWGLLGGLTGFLVITTDPEKLEDPSEGRHNEEPEFPEMDTTRTWGLGRHRISAGRGSE